MQHPLVSDVWCADPVTNLGTVAVGCEVPVEFTLANRADRLAHHLRIRGDCPCTRTHPTSLTIGPGEERTIQVYLNLDEMGDPSADEFEFAQDVTVEARTDSGVTQTLPLSIRGTASRAITITPEPVSFGTAIHGDQPAAWCDVRARGPDLLDVTLAIGPQGVALGEVQRLAGSSALRLHLVWAPDGPQWMQGHVRLDCALANGRRVQAWAPVTGRMVNEVFALPGAVILAARLGAAGRPDAVRLFSRRGAPFAITSASCSASSLALEADRAGEGGYAVAVRPGAGSGPVDGIVSFRVRTGGGLHEDIEVPVVGYL